MAKFAVTVINMSMIYAIIAALPEASPDYRSFYFLRDSPKRKGIYCFESVLHLPLNDLQLRYRIHFSLVILTLE